MYIYICIFICIYIYTFFCFFSFRSDDRKMERSTRSRSRLEVRPASFERANVMVPTLLLFEDGITTRKKRVSGDFVGEKGRNYSFLSVLTIAYQRRSPKPRAASDPRIHDRWTIQRAELFVAAWLVPPFSSSFFLFFSFIFRRRSCGENPRDPFDTWIPWYIYFYRSPNGRSCRV